MQAPAVRCITGQYKAVPIRELRRYRAGLGGDVEWCSVVGRATCTRGRAMPHISCPFLADLFQHLYPHFFPMHTHHLIGDLGTQAGGARLVPGGGAGRRVDAHDALQGVQACHVRRGKEKVGAGSMPEGCHSMRGCGHTHLLSDHALAGHVGELAASLERGVRTAGLAQLQHVLQGCK